MVIPSPGRSRLSVSSNLSRLLSALGCKKGPKPSCTVSTCHYQSYAEPEAVLSTLVFSIAIFDWCRPPLAAFFSLLKPSQGRADVLDVETSTLVFRPAAAFTWDVPQVGLVSSLRAVRGLKSCQACTRCPCYHSSCYGRACRSPNPRSRAL